MSQADSPNITSPSRPAVLAGISVAAVPMAAAVEKSVAATGLGDDSELFAHKPAFDRLFNEWVCLKLASHAEHEEHEVWHQKVFGFRQKERPDIDCDDPEWVAYIDTYRELRRRAGGTEADEPSKWDALTKVFYPLADDILAYKATTIEGLRLQVRALISAYEETWNPDEYDEDQPSDPWLRDFVRSACNVLDVPFPPLPEGVR
jgi:hypothetical protein